MVTERTVERVLRDFKKGRISTKGILRYLSNMPYKDIKFAKVDTHRHLRRGFAEVILCQNKTPDQIIRISKVLIRNKQPLLLTKLSREKFNLLKRPLKQLSYNEEANIAFFDAKGRLNRRKRGIVLIMTGGTSDIPFAEEAAVTLEVMGNPVKRLYDVGVAGIHRLFDKKKLLDEASVIIVVAGMDGALPSVVSGLTSKPVIAVPTSIGYGANFNGLSALLSMLNSCSPGIAVVNIDNGFGAGYFASLINK